VERDEEEIRVWVTNQKDHGQRPRALESLALTAKEQPPALTLKFPGLWLLNISPKLKLLVAFVPIHASSTRFYVRSYHRFRLPLIRTIVSWALGLSNRLILNQDERVVSSQTPTSSLDAVDHPLGCDRAILAFRKWYRSHIETAPAEHECRQWVFSSFRLCTSPQKVICYECPKPLDQEKIPAIRHRHRLAV
jgi:hypothetical protein